MAEATKKNTDVYINLVNGNAVLQNSSGKAIGKVTLEYQDSLTVHPGTGFDGTPALSSIEIFNWVNGAKGASVGSWTGTTTNIGVLNLTNSNNDVVITDCDTGDADADYGYSVKASATKNGKTTYHTADPELMAKKRPTGGGRSVAARKVTRRPPEAGA